MKSKGLAVMVALAIGLLMEGCVTEDGPQPSQTTCVYERIPLRVGLKDVDPDQRYALRRTDEGLEYWLNVADGDRRPENLWVLQHDRCDKDGRCILKAKNSQAIWYLSGCERNFTLEKKSGVFPLSIQFEALSDK